MKVRSRACLSLPLVLIVAALAVSCGVKGDFGFKKFGEDTYHRIEGLPEFAADEEVAWVFLLKKPYPGHVIGVVCQKKELVWVDVMTGQQRIRETDRAVYGTIRDLRPGEYRIVLTDVKDDNGIIATRDFIVYERDEGEE